MFSLFFSTSASGASLPLRCRVSIGHGQDGCTQFQFSFKKTLSGGELNFCYWLLTNGCWVYEADALHSVLLLASGWRFYVLHSYFMPHLPCWRDRIVPLISLPWSHLVFQSILITLCLSSARGLYPVGYWKLAQMQASLPTVFLFQVLCGATLGMLAFPDGVPVCLYWQEDILFLFKGIWSGIVLPECKILSRECLACHSLVLLTESHSHKLREQEQ